MSKSQVLLWQQVIKCAISNSTDYTQTYPSVTACDEKILSSSAIQFINKRESCGESEAKRLYENCKEKALKQKSADGKFPLWAVGGSIVSLFACIMNAINFFVSGFNWLFLVFLAIAISLATVCNDTMRKTSALRKAAIIWKECVKAGTSDVMEYAFEQMENVLK